MGRIKTSATKYWWSARMFSAWNLYPIANGLADERYASTLDGLKPTFGKATANASKTS